VQNAKFIRRFLGAIAGAVALSITTLVYHLLFFRPALHDGQYGMVWIFTVPAGVILGASTGYAIVIFRDQPVLAGIACIIALCLVSIPLGLYLLMTTANSSNTSSTPIPTFLGSVFFGLPTILWLIALLMWGFRLLVK
jgi:hypothetical protein